MTYELRIPPNLEPLVRDQAAKEDCPVPDFLLRVVTQAVTATVPDETFDRALADVAPYTRDVFTWHDQHRAVDG
jgi:hypothetical protein